MKNLVLSDGTTEKIKLGDTVRVNFQNGCQSVLMIGTVVGYGNYDIKIADKFNGRKITIMDSSINDIEFLVCEEAADVVNHPSHYQSAKGLEVINVIEAFCAGLEGIEATDTGNVIKYICRWKHKNGIEDLKKARWYLNHLIDHVEKEN